MLFLCQSLWVKPPPLLSPCRSLLVLASGALWFQRATDNGERNYGILVHFLAETYLTATVQPELLSQLLERPIHRFGRGGYIYRKPEAPLVGELEFGSA